MLDAPLLVDQDPINPTPKFLIILFSLSLKDDSIDSKYGQLHRKIFGHEKFLESGAFLKFDSFQCVWSESKCVQFGPFNSMFFSAHVIKSPLFCSFHQ